MNNFSEKLAHLNVGEVAVAEDALLDGPRALGVCGEELVVVVCLYEKGGKAAETGFHGRGHLPCIRDETKTIGSISDYKAYGIDRIVLDGEGLNREMGNGEDLACLENVPIGSFQALLFYDTGGIAGGEDLCGLLFEKIFQAADVVAVLVG